MSAERSAFAARRLKLSVRGVIENMKGGFTGDDGTRYELFGAGGGETLAADLGVPLLGQVPLVNAVRLGGDEGHPVTAVDPESETARRLPGDRGEAGGPRPGPGLPAGSSACAEPGGAGGAQAPLEVGDVARVAVVEHDLIAA